MNNLKAEMSRYGITVTTVQKVLGISDKSTRNKLDGKTQFTVEEAIRLRDELFPSLTFEYLFRS